AALSDREAVDTRMPAQRAALAVHDRPGAVLGGRLPLHEARVVPVGDEADLLALRLVGGGQAALPGQPPHLGLLEVAHREEGGGELGLAEAEQEVRLVLAAVASF